jgi:hypothetical protein
LKDDVGNVIFDFVKKLVGQQKAPKVTGMLIALPLDQIKEYLKSYENL